MSVACNLLDLLQYSMLNALVNKMGTMLCLNSVKGSNSVKLTEIGKSSASQKSVKSERTRLKNNSFISPFHH